MENFQKKALFREFVEKKIDRILISRDALKLFRISGCGKLDILFDGMFKLVIRVYISFLHRIA